MNLRQSLNALVVAGVASVLAMAATSFIQEAATTSSIHREMTAAVVTADILPPPLYLLELRLVLGMVVDGSMPVSQARTEAQRLRSEYQARIDFYKANPPFGLEKQLLGEQHDAGQRFLDAAAKVLGAVESGDAAAARAALHTAHVDYLAHRHGVDITVKVASDFAQNAAAGREAAFVQQRRSLVSLGLLAFAALLGLGWWVRRSTLASTGGEPADVARVAHAIAAGDLGVKVHVVPGDTTSVMAAPNSNDTPYSLRRSSRASSAQRTIAASSPNSAIAAAMAQTTETLAIRP